MSRAEDSLALQCRVELAEWHESGDTGCTVTFRLSESDSLDLIKAAFSSSANDADPRYLLHLMKVNGSDSAVDPARRERLARALQIEPSSRNALTLCRDPDFWRYLELIDFAAVNGEIDAVHAKQYIYRLCDIKCRRDLDNDRKAARQYQMLVVKPFLAWLDARSC
ncbi:MAG: hypothetical protein BMS9Abin10_0990 [Gammaproteobacteria bacterium]|nr:MAG: hypothetical protein BMS9Abin10_0990 [Gammaproteobacteria bacterium]